MDRPDADVTSGTIPEPAEGGLWFGADYNPEQWDRATWADDVRLMKIAGVNIVSVGIFSWSQVQPTENSWQFGWLDDVLDLLHENGIAVDLATSTASPPPWLTIKHPEILPVNDRGETLHSGGRQHWRPTSPVFRSYALKLTTRLAHRYANHPAVVAWHINNEIGCHNAYDHSDDATVAFRIWLQERYGSIECLNESWGTAFWSQRYGDFDEILTPRIAAATINPTQQLDFKRFSSAALLDHLLSERNVLKRWSPSTPVTTNFMVMDSISAMNYEDWVHVVDFVSNDHYVNVARADRHDELSFSANLVGGLSGGRPWFLMEHSTSAVNWQPINRAKSRGELTADALTHVAHGADGICFFQWRQSRAGSEKFHSAMVPHAGEDTDLFRDVTRLGETMRTLGELRGAHRARSNVALLFDWESWWASEQDSHHTERFSYRDEAIRWHRAVIDGGHRVDVIPAGADFGEYRLIVVPSLHVITREMARRLISFVEAGGHVVLTFNSGVVDEDDHAWLHGYPGPLRELVGVRVDEIRPLPVGEIVAVGRGATSSYWTELVKVLDPTVEVLAHYETGDLAGRAAITMRKAGLGGATYVSADLDPGSRAAVVAEALDRAGVEPEVPEDLRGKIEVTRRTGSGTDVRFVINKTDDDLDITSIAGRGRNLGSVPLTDGMLPARGVAVLLSPSSSGPAVTPANVETTPTAGN